MLQTKLNAARPVQRFGCLLFLTLSRWLLLLGACTRCSQITLCNRVPYVRSPTAQGPALRLEDNAFRLLQLKHNCPSSIAVNSGFTLLLLSNMPEVLCHTWHGIFDLDYDRSEPQPVTFESEIALSSGCARALGLLTSPDCTACCTCATVNCASNP
jgi:hypothetical protein